MARRPVKEGTGYPVKKDPFDFSLSSWLNMVDIGKTLNCHANYFALVCENRESYNIL